MRVSPFGYPGITAHLRLPRAFRSLSRPSSAPGAGAFAPRPCSLDLLQSAFLMLAYIEKRFFGLFGSMCSILLSQDGSVFSFQSTRCSAHVFNLC